MAAFSINSVGANSSSVQTVNTNSMGAMGGEQFMILLLAQLRNQNPLEPMEDKDLMGQITQLNSLQELQKLNEALLNMGKSNKLTETVDMIGKVVEFTADDGSVESGVVTGVSMVNDQPMLWVGDWMVPIAAVITVSSEAAAEPEG